MSFATEFKSMRQGGAPKITDEAAKAADSAAAAKDAEAAKAPDAEAAQDGFPNPFVDGQTLGEAVEAQGEETPVVPPAPEPAKPVKVKINGKEFNSVEEATDYAAKLEIELEKTEAFNKGMQAAKPAEVKPPEVKISKKMADKMFEDPEGFVEDMQKLITEQAEKLVNAREAAKQAKETQERETKDLWTGFYKDYSDLGDWTDEVNIVFQRELPNIQDLPTKEALSILADKTRAYVASVKERALPKQVLPSKTAQTASAGLKAATATNKSATEKKISFADQVRSASRRTAVQSE